MRPDTCDHRRVSLHHRRESHFQLGFGVTCSLHDGLGLFTPRHKELVLIYVGHDVIHFLHSVAVTAIPGSLVFCNTSKIQTVLANDNKMKVTQVSFAQSTPSFCWWGWWSFCFGGQRSSCPTLEDTAPWDFLSSRCHMKTGVYRGRANCQPGKMGMCPPLSTASNEIKRAYYILVCSCRWAGQQVPERTVLGDHWCFLSWAFYVTSRKIKNKHLTMWGKTTG